MSEITLVGNGFVGKNLHELFQDSIVDVYDSKNIGRISDKKHQVLFCAAPGAKKWLANQDPQKDETSCQLLISNVLKTKTEKIVLFSTVDIYPVGKIIENEEDVTCSCEPYGAHRRLIEMAVQEHFNNYHIIRLPALFGKYLQKNYIFDLLNNNNLRAVKLRSSFQWLYIKRIKFFIDFVINNQVKLLNLTTQPLDTEELVTKFFLNKRELLNNKEDGSSYCVKSKYFKEFALNKSDVLSDLEDYIDEYRYNNSRNGSTT